jgi:hypothetical protein
LSAQSSCTTQVPGRESSIGSAASRWQELTWPSSGFALGRWTPPRQRWEPVLSLPSAQRITDLTTPLAGVRDELASPIFRGSVQAPEQIEEFGRETIVTGLHSLPADGSTQV